MNFGREVRRRRRALGLTLDELAERSDLTPNYVGTIETGKRDPSLSTVRALARGLRVPIADLFGSDDGVAPAALEAARLFEMAPPDVQEALLTVLRGVARRRR